MEIISAAAGRISGGNLAERIPIREPDSELGRLAGVLNRTFARLEAAFNQQRQFTADASHELRTNAIHYNRDGGEVCLSSGLTEGTARLEVTDSGPGIAPEKLPHVFDRFYRADPSRARAEGRTGLGLAISQAIVEAHHGRLEATSEPGKGSTFTLSLPAVDPESEGG